MHRELVSSVKRLSQAAEAQIAWIGSAHPDELGLEFDNFLTAARSNDLSLSQQVLRTPVPVDAAGWPTSQDN
jgi:hypothetical protein